MDFKPEILDIYEKFEELGGRYVPNETERLLIRSAEYAFLQGYKSGIPQNESKRVVQLKNDEAWFRAVGGKDNTGVSDWLCELTQNAFDLNATKCKIVIKNTDGVLEFGHNGRGVQGPDTLYGEKIGDVLALMSAGTSKKTYDLYSEGRFGIGFKYWKQHFSRVAMISDGFRLKWSSDYLNPEIERREMGDYAGWTVFQFSEPTETVGMDDTNPLDLKIDDLRRLKNAIRMRDTNFNLKIKIIDIDKSQKFIWNHEIKEEFDFQGQRILSCLDSEPGVKNHRKSTLMLVNPKSDFFPELLIQDLTNVSIESLKNLNKRRLENNKDPIASDPKEQIRKWLSERFFVFGFFHEEGDNGNLLSMFPITEEGQTNSRISFSAPFDIAHSRLSLNKLSHLQLTETNRILIHMMMHSTANS